MNPEFYDYVWEALKNAGALDVSLIPLHMKKNRPGILVKVLTSPDQLDACQRLLFRETTAIGCRVYPVEKYMLPYEIITVTGPWGPQAARVKVARRGAELYNCAPEYDDCHQIALAQGLPIKRVYDIVKNVALDLLSEA